MADSKFPSSIIIIGAGIFGLSTALAISRRHPSTKITIIDRLTPPIEDGSSVDTTRCIRADYADPIYAQLALEAQQKIEADPDLSRYYFKQGMTFVCDGKPSRFTDIWHAQVKLARGRHHQDQIISLSSSQEVFERIHGSGSELPTKTKLGRELRWNKAYCNLDDAFIDARECVRIYYERCLAQPSITFQCGVAVDHLNLIDGICHGVILEDGSVHKAEKLLVAAGAWSSKLVFLEGRMYSSAIEVAWFKVTPEEEEKWKHMSITTNLSTGLNVFPPYKGEIKVLRRSAGYCNTVTIENPEDRKNKIEVSLPRTSITHPGMHMPEEAEKLMRQDLQEIMPSLAQRAFDRTKLCWLAQAPTADFLIAPHPRISGLHVATAGSAHAWKFLPVIGDLVLDSMEGHLSPALTEKWAWSLEGRDGGNAPRMDGKPVELREIFGE
ncbi:putative fructosyl amino acid oxidasesarcosine oxidase [Mollisia scopiformis]|uniref:Putative fructosyl amino acid oxidasesarcosine oxidase n=1 Tax=Mollisia scopiformis TaxID=149040 RepID=A0A194X120_MOLSC|nr:putative fructosyl amino acid oxidasesarcosine oxidase [Mollisia scopiformis]KUJ13890.1 putative fructosyl amino acid oxidasesarcosine oxidase [Mollisia scopiformis]